MSRQMNEEELLLQEEEDEETEIGRQTVYEPEGKGKNPYNTKKNHLLTGLAMLILAAALTIAQYADDRHLLEPFHPVADVILHQQTTGPAGDRLYREENIYMSVGADRRYEETAPFEGGGSLCFITGVYEHEKERMNFLTDRTLSPYASRGGAEEIKAAQEDPVFGRMLDLIEQTETEHWMIQARLYLLDGEYFACVDRNVNLWTPYVLYYYSRERDELIHLATFDGMTVADLRLAEDFGERVGR